MNDTSGRKTNTLRDSPGVLTRLIPAVACLLRPVALLVYTCIKKCHPQRFKVTFLSRQSSEMPLDFVLLKEELALREPKLEIAQHCGRDEGGLRAQLSQLNPRRLFPELRDIASSQVVVLDGYAPTISFFKQRPELYVLQLWHAFGAFKKFGYQSLDLPGGRASTIARALHMHEGYSAILCAGEVTRPVFAEAFRVDDSVLETALLPRADSLYEYHNDHPDPKHIVYAPTFRDTPAERARWITAAAELAEVCDLAGLTLSICVHPLAPAQFAADGLSDIYERIRPYLDTRPTLEVLRESAHLITDYSAVAFEAALAGRAVWFYPYDLDEYVRNRGININTVEELPAATYESPAALVDALRAPAASSEAEQERAMFFRRYLDMSCYQQVPEDSDTLRRTGAALGLPLSQKKNQSPSHAATRQVADLIAQHFCKGTECTHAPR